MHPPMQLAEVKHGCLSWMLNTIDVGFYPEIQRNSSLVMINRALDQACILTADPPPAQAFPMNIS
jgi:hypothetical protein